MQTNEIKSLPIENRIMLMEELWDSLCHENEEMKSPSWHKEILADRMQAIQSGKSKFISIDELKIAINETELKTRI